MNNMNNGDYPIFEIIQDTREQTPWRLTYHRECSAQHKKTLHTGDYTVKGFEDLICIERKASTNELSINLGKNHKQFRAELERMIQFPFRFIVCEFPESYIDMFPQKSGIPKYLWNSLQMTGKFMKKRLLEWTELFEIELVFAKDRFLAQTATIHLLSPIIQGLRDGKTVEETIYEISRRDQSHIG